MTPMKPKNKKFANNRLVIPGPVFHPPTLEIRDAVVACLCFTNFFSLERSLARVHRTYDGKLNGPLRGVNFPIDVYEEWLATVGIESLTEEEKCAYNLLSSRDEAPSKINVGAEDSNLARKVLESSIEFKTLPFNEEFLHSTFQELSSNLNENRRIKYILAYTQNDKATYIHEWAHALYYINPLYKQLSETLYQDLDPLVRLYINKELKIRGYREDLFIDEFQAYILEGPAELGKKYVNEMGMIHQRLKVACNSTMISNAS